MRRWPGQQGQNSPCLFCLFGISRGPVARPFLRELSTTPTRLRDRALITPRWSVLGRPGQEERRQNNRRTSELEPLRFSGRRIGRPRRSSTEKEDDVESEGPSEAQLLKKARHCLRIVYKWIDSSRGDAPSLVQSLDPDRKRWREFETSIVEIYERPFNDLSEPQKKHRREMGTVLNGESMIESRTNYLYFEYLDQVLAAKGMDVTQSLERGIDLRYPTEWYPEARATPREIHLHIGPTNSGKTYNALKRLENALSGFYAGPLRLLAHEVYSRFNSIGLPCDLVTGDDVRRDVPDFATPLYASTVEMVDVGQAVDVAVIDEIQMIADVQRGWAWTRALIATRARELHLCGEPRVLPLIKELAASMGDNLHVHQYERLNPLRVETKSLRGDFKKLRKGDCVVTFSIVNIHALRKQIELQSGRRVAIVYGSLPPETRAQQAALFNDPDNDYDFLVASDAIGMGLNLAIKRIIFDAVHKFDGVVRRQLSIPQIKQIAGRAGRFRTSRDDTHKKLDAHDPAKKGDPTNAGYVTCVDEVDLPIIQDALKQEAPPIRQAGLLPMGDFIIAYANRLPAGVSHEYVMQRLCDAATVHPRFTLCQIKDQVNIARTIEEVPGLTTADRCILVASPANYRDKLDKDVLRAMARCAGKRKQVRVVDIPQVPLEVLEEPMSPDHFYLERLTGLHKALILFLWLSYRFNTIFMEKDMAFHAKELTEEKINTYLTMYSANKQLNRRLKKQLASGHSKQLDLTQSSQEGADFSEHASEDLAEEEPGYRQGTDFHDDSALPINWSRGASGGSPENLTDDVQEQGRAAGGNG